MSLTMTLSLLLSILAMEVVKKACDLSLGRRCKLQVNVRMHAVPVHLVSEAVACRVWSDLIMNNSCLICLLKRC